MTIEIFTRDKDETLSRSLTVWLCRVVGLALFGMGLVYWTRLVGIYDGPLWRFDLMPVWWRIAAPTLAVLYPVAGIGLWMIASWGTVIWILIVVVETVMHLGFPQFFGQEPIIVGLHISALALLGVLRVVTAFERRRRRRR